MGDNDSLEFQIKQSFSWHRERHTYDLLINGDFGTKEIHEPLETPCQNDIVLMVKYRNIEKKCMHCESPYKDGTRLKRKVL